MIFFFCTWKRLKPVFIGGGAEAECTGIPVIAGTKVGRHLYLKLQAWEKMRRRRAREKNIKKPVWWLDCDFTLSRHAGPTKSWFRHEAIKRASLFPSVVWSQSLSAQTQRRSALNLDVRMRTDLETGWKNLFWCFFLDSVWTCVGFLFCSVKEERANCLNTTENPPLPKYSSAR